MTTIVKPCESLYIHTGFNLAVNDNADHNFMVHESPELKENIMRLDGKPDQPFVIGEFILAVISQGCCLKSGIITIIFLSYLIIYFCVPIV